MDTLSPHMIGGGILDLILIDVGVLGIRFEALAPGTGGSDHAFVLLRFPVPRSCRPQPQLRWQYHRDADWDRFDRILQPLLVSWYVWFVEVVGGSDKEARLQILNEAEFVLGLLVQGTVYWENAQLGAFRRGGGAQPSHEGLEWAV